MDEHRFDWAAKELTRGSALRVFGISIAALATLAQDPADARNRRRRKRRHRVDQQALVPAPVPQSLPFCPVNAGCCSPVSIGCSSGITCRCPAGTFCTDRLFEPNPVCRTPEACVAACGACPTGQQGFCSKSVDDDSLWCATPTQPRITCDTGNDCPTKLCVAFGPCGIFPGGLSCAAAGFTQLKI